MKTRWPTKGVPAGLVAFATPALTEKNWTPPPRRINARTTAERIRSQHPELLGVALHGAPPGQKYVFTMFAGSFPKRICNRDDPNVIDVRTNGIGIVGPRWHGNDSPDRFVAPIRPRDSGPCL